MNKWKNKQAKNKKQTKKTNTATIYCIFAQYDIKAELSDTELDFLFKKQKITDKSCF